MRRRRDLDFPVRLVVMFAIALAAGTSASRAQDRGTCVTANVPEAFSLPDGSEHAAGRLTVCALQAFTPALELHSVWVEGGGAKFAMSRRAVPGEYTDTRSSFLFRRGKDGALDLIGYVVPFGGKSWSYTMQRTNGGGFGEPRPTARTRAPGHTVTLEAASAEPQG